MNIKYKQTFILSIQDSDWLEVGESLPSRPLLLRGRPRRLRDGHPAERKAETANIKNQRMYEKRATNNLNI